MFASYRHVAAINLRRRWLRNGLNEAEVAGKTKINIIRLREITRFFDGEPATLAELKAIASLLNVSLIKIFVFVIKCRFTNWKSLQKQIKKTLE